MNQNLTAEIKKWFEEYFHSFLEKSPSSGSIRAMLELKYDHSLRVAEEARSMAEEMGWGQEDQLTAEMIGLLHDIGRFSQMTEYGTFRDADSVDHAVRGYEVLRASTSLLFGFSEVSPKHLLSAVLCHNRRQLPKDTHSESLSWIRLIRDADKLDIFRIFGEVMTSGRLEEFPEIIHNVQIDGPPSREILEQMELEQVPNYQLIRSLNDWKLLQASWIYDLSYPPAFRRVKERGILNLYTRLLPDTQEIRSALQAVHFRLDIGCGFLIPDGIRKA